MAFQLFKEQVENSSDCSNFFDPQNEAYEKTEVEAIQQVKQFQVRSRFSQTWPYSREQKGYHIPTSEILKLLAQNNGNTTGIKIYFGERTIIIDGASITTLELIIVATHSYAGSVNSDFNIPIDNSTGYKAYIAGARPCPKQCGGENVLNRDI